MNPQYKHIGNEHYVASRDYKSLLLGEDVEVLVPVWTGAEFFMASVDDVEDSDAQAGMQEEEAA